MRLIKFLIVACLFSLSSPLISAPFSPPPITEELLADQKSVDKDEQAVHDKEQKGEDKKEDQPPPETEEPRPTSDDVQAATESYETAFIKTIIVLVGLLVLVLLTVWMFKKISHGRLRNFNYLKSIKIIEKRPLSPKSMLYLIEVGGKQVLIAESQLEVRPVTSLDWLGSEKDL